MSILIIKNLIESQDHNGFIYEALYLIVANRTTIVPLHHIAASGCSSWTILLCFHVAHIALTIMAMTTTLSQKGKNPTLPTILSFQPISFRNIYVSAHPFCIRSVIRFKPILPSKKTRGIWRASKSISAENNWVAENGRTARGLLEVGRVPVT